MSACLVLQMGILSSGGMLFCVRSYMEDFTRFLASFYLSPCLSIPKTTSFSMVLARHLI